LTKIWFSFVIKVMRFKIFWLFALSILFLAGCHQEPDALKLYDELVVSTNFDESADFNSYATYAIPTDTIGFVSNDPEDDTIWVTSTANQFPKTIIQNVITNLNGRGFSRVAKNSNPDLGISISIVKDFNVFQQINYPSSYYYPGSYYSGYYGYGSAYYYPYITTQVYRSAVLVIEVVDLKNRTPDNKVKIVWNAYLGDLYHTVTLIDQTVAGIDQAFKQSTYLKAAR
jgi:hypothetical protein